MFISLNKKKLKRAGTGVLAAVLAVGLAAGYRVMEPGNMGKAEIGETDRQGVNETLLLRNCLSMTLITVEKKEIRHYI